MARPIHTRSRDPLAAPLVVLALALSPFTAPFSTSDLSDHHGDSVARQAEIFATKMAVDEDVAVVGAPPAAETASPVFLLVAGPAVADETSKHQIPSRILRL